MPLPTPPWQTFGSDGPVGGSPGPLAQLRPSSLASFERKWAPARQVLEARGVPRTAWAPVMEIDLQRASAGQSVLSARETMLALRAAMTREAQTERPQGNLLTRAARDVRQVVSAVPHLPGMLINEVQELPQAPAQIAENLAEGDIEGLTQVPGVRMLPGAFTVGNIAAGRSPLEHPVLSLLDISPFVAKGLSSLPKTKIARAAAREEGKLLAGGAYRTTAREYLMKPRAARYEARTGRPYEGWMTKFGLSPKHQGEAMKIAQVEARRAGAAMDDFGQRVVKIYQRRKIDDARRPLIYEAAQTGRHFGELTPNEAMAAEELGAEINRLAETEGVVLNEENIREGIVKVEVAPGQHEYYEARSGVPAKIRTVDKELAAKARGIEKLGPKVAGIRHGRAYMEDLIEGNPYWDVDSQTFATPDERIQSVPIEQIADEWAAGQNLPVSGQQALNAMVDEHGWEGARFIIEKEHDRLLADATDDVIGGEVKADIENAGQPVVMRQKPGERFLDIRGINYGDITSPQKAIMDAVQGMGPIHAALQEYLGTPDPLKAAYWDVPPNANPVDTPLFRMNERGTWEATDEFFANRNEVRAELESKLREIPDKALVDALGSRIRVAMGSSAAAIRRSIMRVFDKVELSTDVLALRANEALRNRLYRNKNARAKVVERATGRGQITMAAEKSAKIADDLTADLAKIENTLREQADAMEAADVVGGPKHEIIQETSPLDYGWGPGVDGFGNPIRRLEIRDPNAPAPTELHFAGIDPTAVAWLDYSPSLRRPGETYIYFVTSRGAGYRGKGLARGLIEEVYATSDEAIDFGKIEAPEIEAIRHAMTEKYPDRGNYGKPQSLSIVDEGAEMFRKSKVKQKQLSAKAKAHMAARVEARMDSLDTIRRGYTAEINKWATRADELQTIGEFLKYRKAYRDKAQRLPTYEERLSRLTREQKEAAARRQEVLEANPPGAYEPLVQETATRMAKEKFAEKYAEGSRVSERLKEAGEQPPEVDWAEVTIRTEEGLTLNVPGLSPSEITGIMIEARKTWMDLKAVAPSPPVFTHSVNVGQAQQLGQPFRPLVKQEKVATSLKGKTVDPSPVVKDLEIAVLHQGRELIQQVMDRNIRTAFTEKWAKSGEQAIAEYENIARRMIEQGVETPTGTTVGALADHMINQELTLWNPKSLTPLSKGHLTRANIRKAMFVPKWLDKAMTDMYPYSRSALAGVLDKSHNLFRLSILPLSPRWHINNIVGGMVMLLAEGGPGVLAHWGAARKLLKSGELPDEIARGAGTVQGGDAAWSLSVGRDLGRVWENEYLRKVQTGGKTAAGKFRQATDASFAAGEYVDKFYRALAFLEGKSKGERLGLTPKASRTAGIEMANRVLQDWDAMTPVERSVIRMVFPFYGWMKHIMRYTFGMAVDHPTRTAIMSNFARNEWEDWGTGIPERFFQMYVLGKPDKNGTIQSNLSLNPFNISGAINVKGTNPFSDVGNYMTLAGFVGQLSPVGGGFLEAMGINSATGTANLYPDTAYNEVLGRNVATQGNVGVSILRNVIPQFDFVLDQIGMTPAELKNLKLNDPDLYNQRIMSAMGIPFIPRDINLEREAALAEIARDDDQINAMNQALRSGDWSQARQYPALDRLLTVLSSIPRSAIEPFMIGQRPQLAS